MPLMIEGLSFLGCQGFLLSIYSATTTRCLSLPWRKFPICHYSQHASLPLALHFRICPLASQGTLKEEKKAVVKVCITPRSVCSKQQCSQAAAAAAAAFTFYTQKREREPGTTVAADVRIWLLGQLFESEETRSFVEIYHNHALLVQAGNPQMRPSL